VRWSLWVAGCSTSGTHARPLVPRGDAPAIGSGGGAAGTIRWERDWSALCSRLLGGARLCSLLLSADLQKLAKPQVGGVVATILTSKGPVVRTHLRPPPGQRVAGEQRRGLAGEH
jgi:hypothetical protein